jgi:oxalate decarboxylase/phosphoglucose isomerase-like protein (cupin superfamily)
LVDTCLIPIVLGHKESNSGRSHCVVTAIYCRAELQTLSLKLSL